jgi:putative glutamine amidotransferase
MKSKKSGNAFLPALAALLVLAGLSFGLLSQNETEKIGQAPSGTADKITVLAFYPTVDTVKDLLTLRRNNLIDLPNLEVVGVYHVKEKTDYQKSKAFVTENGLDWFAFRPISAPLSAEVVFQTNACTPEFEKVFNQADGVIFFGGQDIPPYLYKEETDFLTIIEDPYRHFLELSFIFHLLGGRQDDAFVPLLDKRPDFPVLGMCLGCQSLNVGTGGTLTQDIWSEIFEVNTLEDAIALGVTKWHSNPYARLLPQERLSGFIFHEVRFAEQGRFQREIDWNVQDYPLVLSSHHQQIEKPGKGLRVIASSLDGKVIEAIEHERYSRVLGVQFHPEVWMLFDQGYLARFTPLDLTSFGLKAYLENRPPSLPFHRKLWSWVSRGWQDEHQRK